MVVVTFNATPAFYANVLTTAICIMILVLVIRIPFKRTYHWTFLLFIASLTWFAFIGILEQASFTVQQYYGWLSWQAIANQYGSTALLYLFVIQFGRTKIADWQKIPLVGAFAWYGVNAVGYFADEPLFVKHYGRITPTGTSAIAGPAAIYVSPFGINIIYTIITILILVQIVRKYRIDKAPLVRSQLVYITVGALFLYIGNVGSIITIVFQNLPTGAIQVSRAIVAGVLLVGLTRHGFYRVNPVKETATVNPGVADGIPEWAIKLEEHRSYIFTDPQSPFEAFASLVRSAGMNGLIITRMFPDGVRAKYGLQTTPIRWLAEERRDDAIAPGDLLGLSLTVKDFYQNATKPVVLFHGIEYLTTVNGTFSPILKLIQSLNEVNAERGGILLLSITPGALEERDENLLLTEVTSLHMT